MLYSRNLIESIPKKIPVGCALWEEKQTLEDLRILEIGDPYTFSSQYQQSPSLSGGGMFRPEFFKYYDVLPPDISVIRIYGDTAQKTKERNDFSVFQCWAKSPTMGIFLLDQCRGKWEAPELESTLVAFWDKHKPTRRKPRGSQLIKIEDKSSGSSLIQSIRQDYMIPIEGIQRNTDKVLRAMGVVKYFASGHIHLPKNVDYIHDYKEEFRKFSPMMTHKHDDQIDPTMDAVEDLIVFENNLYSGVTLA